MQETVINIFLGLLDLENYFKWSGKREEGFVILATRQRLKLYFKWGHRFRSNEHFNY